VDQASFPSDTVSTHSIARSGVVQLRRWGLLDEVLDSGAPAIRQVTFNAAGESTTWTIKDKAGVDFLVAPRRYVLDTLLATAAEHAGAEVRPGVTVTGLQRDGREAGQAGGAVQYAYYAGIPWSGIEFFVAERSFAGVFPTHDSQAFSGLLGVVGDLGPAGGHAAVGAVPRSAQATPVGPRHRRGGTT
jgi:hypothetical protein